MYIDELSARIVRIREHIIQQTGSRLQVEKQVRGMRDEIEQLLKERTLYMEVRRLFELFVKSTEYSIKEYIEPVVSDALKFVFAQELDFKILFQERRNQIEVDFFVLRNSEMRLLYERYMQDPGSNSAEFDVLVKETSALDIMYGGAANQVIGMVLRFAIAELLQIKGPIVLDEPSSAVGENFNSRLGELIFSLSEHFNRQYIIITHSKALAAYGDRQYEAHMVDKICQLREIGGIGGSEFTSS